MGKVHYSYGESRESYRESGGYVLLSYRTACGVWLSDDPRLVVFSAGDVSCKRCLGVLSRRGDDPESVSLYVRRRMSNGEFRIFRRDGKVAPIPSSIVSSFGDTVIEGSDDVSDVSDVSVAIKTRRGKFLRERDDR